ncbi:MAG: tetratricopeptide repeat protein [Acidobacteria bacterium]|nr:tetratricopeptide repeat protein [Acidobacteriota bacterium]
MGVDMRRLCATAALVCALGVPGLAWAQQTDPLVANSDDPIELQQLGVRFIATNQTRNALEALRKALEIYPDNAETRMWLGVVYTQMGEDIAAEGEFHRALEINPQLTEVHNWFGVYWARRGNFDASIAEYRKALADPAYPNISRARVQVNLGNVLMQTGEHEQAVRELSAAARVSIPSSDPLFSLINLSLAEGLVKTGRPQEALGALERLEVLPPDPRGSYLTGLAYRDLGEFGQARDHLSRVLRLAPGTELSRDALSTLESLPSESN